MLVLASASPRRRELLSRLGVEFVVREVDVDETPPPSSPPEDAARAIAERKALAGAARTELPVLAADTIVVAQDGEILGKPRDEKDACRMLRKLSGTTHRVVTGVALVRHRAPDRPSGGGKGSSSTRVDSSSEITWVTMRAMTDAEIAEYVASGEPFGKAGSYAIQESADRFVTSVNGSWTNVVGLPLETVQRMLTAAGIATDPSGLGGPPRDPST